LLATLSRLLLLLLTRLLILLAALVLPAALIWIVHVFPLFVLVFTQGANRSRVCHFHFVVNYI
jgi:cytoskeletal protein RodZ